MQETITAIIKNKKSLIIFIFYAAKMPPNLFGALLSVAFSGVKNHLIEDLPLIHATDI